MIKYVKEDWPDSRYFLIIVRVMEEFINYVYSQPFTDSDEKHFNEYLEEVAHLNHVTQDIEKYGLDEYKKRFKVVSAYYSCTSEYVISLMIHDDDFNLDNYVDSKRL